MGKYRITVEATRDIEQYRQYLSEEASESLANKFLDHIYKKFELLSLFPSIGRKRHDISKGLLSFPDIRFKRTIFYRREATEIIILGVVGARQNLNEIVKNR